MEGHKIGLLYLVSLVYGNEEVDIVLLTWGREC